MTKNDVVVAIDGPGGSGKSTVSKGVAARLGLDHLDTGAMYRVVALLALRRGIALDDEEVLGALAADVDMSVAATVLADGEDVTAAIRTAEVNTAVSFVASKPLVREALVLRQRAWAARRSGVVVEGRDIGSVVLPDADVKIYLTATEQERARRRAGEQGVAHDDAALERTRESIAARDAIDSSRETAPLVVADGAVVIDSTDKSAAEVIDEIVDLALCWVGE